MPITCGPSGPVGQGGVSQVATANQVGNSFQTGGQSLSQITLAAGALPMYVNTVQGGVYQFQRFVSAGGLVNGQTVVDLVMPDGGTQPQSFYCVVYTISGGVLT
jgi:hypothetical protein